MKKERQLIGQGIEHNVYAALSSEKYVLKVPRRFQYLSVMGANSASMIRKEVKDVSEAIDRTNVKLPKTRVFGFKNGYIIAQARIAEDDSVRDVSSQLPTDREYFSSNYHFNPANFISSENNIYIVDPTIGPIERLVERANLALVSIQNYRKLKYHYRDQVRYLVRKVLSPKK